MQCWRRPLTLVTVPNHYFARSYGATFLTVCALEMQTERRKVCIRSLSSLGRFASIQRTSSNCDFLRGGFESSCIEKHPTVARLRLWPHQWRKLMPLSKHRALSALLALEGKTALQQHVGFMSMIHVSACSARGLFKLFHIHYVCKLSCSPVLWAFAVL